MAGDRAPLGVRLLFACVASIAIAPLNILVVEGERVTIKVVPTAPETTPTGPTTINRDNIDYKLQPSRQHPPFAGPNHLRYLHGDCFATVFGSYEWRVCPFDNVTQHEVNSAWNSYNGILGVWDTYEITDGNFSHMIFTDGDGCGGDILRQTKVKFECGPKNITVDPLEPQTCHYIIKFVTPLACHNMSVREALKPSQVKKLDSLNEELRNEEITKLGHTTRVMRLLNDSGLLPKYPTGTKEPATESTTTVTEATTTTVTSTEIPQATTDDPESRMKNLSALVAELQNEVKSLRSQLSKLNSSTHKISSSGKRKKSAPTMTSTHASVTTQASSQEPSSVKSSKSKPTKSKKRTIKTTTRSSRIESRRAASDLGTRKTTKATTTKVSKTSSKKKRNPVSSTHQAKKKSVDSRKTETSVASSTRKSSDITKSTGQKNEHKREKKHPSNQGSTGGSSLKKKRSTTTSPPNTDARTRRRQKSTTETPRKLQF